MRTLAEVYADLTAVERQLKRAQQKADHYNATVAHAEHMRRKLSAEAAQIKMVQG